MKLKKKKSKSNSKSYLSKSEVQPYLDRWLCALPSKVGDLFTLEVAAGSDSTLERIDEYFLEPTKVAHLVALEKELGKGYEVKSMGILMGVSKDKEMFQPILEIKFTKEGGKEKIFCYLLSVIKPSNDRFSLLSRQMTNNQDELDPAIAQLFRLHWHTLTSAELVHAFEGLAANAVKAKSGERVGEVIFSHQKMQRVRRYTYSTLESQHIFEDVKQYDNLSLFLSSGLNVPEFHPFSFRPIININPSGVGSASRLDDGGGSGNNYDTSRPCPPTCPPFN